MTELLKDRIYLHNRHRLSHQQIDSFLGEDRCAEFKEEKIKRLDHIRNFILITDKLRQNNIPFVCLKGPFLSLRLYGDSTIRFSHDIDLLIEEKYLNDAVKVMLAENFEFFQHHSFWPKEKYRQELILQRNHHLEFLNRQKAFLVEIHWVLYSQLTIPVKKVHDIIKDNLTTISFSGRTFTILDKEFELLFLLMHGARHAWARLKWLVDINEYTKQEIDKNKFLHLVKILKAERVILQTNYLLKKYFNNNGFTISAKNSIPKIMLKYADKSINKEHATINYSSNREIIEDKVYQWFIFTGLYYKFSFLPGLLVREIDVIDNNFPNKMAYLLYRPYSYIKRRILHV